MSRIACHSLTALMCISMVTCLAMEYAEIPPAVNDRDVQCIYKHQHGACRNFNWENGGIDCASLQCAGMVTAVPKIYIPTDIGTAENGTRCGLNSVCFMGTCRELPLHISMPKQIGKLSATFECRKPAPGIIIDQSEHH